jgi:glycerol-3-phosphate acyltransferase PlsY
MDDIIDYLGAYLIGSVSVGYVIFQTYKRKGRPGTYWEAVLAALNIIKGAFPVFIAHTLSPTDPPDMVLAGFLVILGDRYPVYSRFKGNPSFWVVPGVFAAILYCMLVK